MAPLRWGVLAATAQVARLAVLPALAVSRSADLVALASRSTDLSGDFAFGARRAYRDYGQLLDDPDVEAVYIPVPNALHLEWGLRAAAAGKHVLCEKPLACSADDALRLVAGCRRTGVLLMEAYMTAFHPRAVVLDRLLAADHLGRLQSARCTFTFRLSRLDDHRWRLEMGGGALLDLGIYCVAPLLVCAERSPAGVAATAKVTAAGVDANVNGWLDFGHGFAAGIECSFDAPERQRLEVVGSEGALTVERAFTPGPDDGLIQLQPVGGSVQDLECGADDPYRLMVEHFAAVVRGEGVLRRTPQDSITALAVLDQLRTAAGLAPAGCRRLGESPGLRWG